MKKVLFVTHCLYGGGSERVLSVLANYLSDNGYDVTIISRKNSDSNYFIEPAVKVIYFETDSHLSFIYKVRQVIKKISPGNVIAFEYFYNLCTILSCMGLKRNVIVSERNDPAIVGSGFLKDKIRNILYKYCNTLVCQTIDAKEYFPPYIQNHSVIILNPLKEGLPNRYFGERSKRVVTFCRLNKQKNLPLLIRAFKIFHQSHPDYSLEIYGNGEERCFLQELVKSSDLKHSVKISNGLSNIHEVIIDAGMFVLPSDYEGLSNSMLEAMAIGLPVICTDCPCGGARMVVHNMENGILIPVRDEDKLVEAMKQLADSTALCNKLSQNAELIKEQLSISKIGEEWVKLLK